MIKKINPLQQLVKFINFVIAVETFDNCRKPLPTKDNDVYTRN